MRNTVLLFFGLLLMVNVSDITSQNNDSSILLKIDDRNITKGEFERIYNKNNSNVDPKSVDEYLELFINFKLKVIEAENLGMDTLPSFIKELRGYRKQLAQPYLTSKEKEEELLKEAYERTLNEVNASHIFMAVPFTKATPEDTLKAYNKLLDLRQRALKGASFEELAKEYSDDRNTKPNGGQLGYFVSFRMIYPLETAAFTTDIGDISMPIRSFYGYHIVKTNDKRESMGQVKVAHIWIRVPKESPDSLVEQARIKIDKCYELLNDGEDFADIAREYSDDKRSARKGGELDWFSAGKMVPDFEKVAFSLKNVGDVSEPFETDFGFHIVTLLDKKPVEPYEELVPRFKEYMNRDDYRKALIKSAVVKKILKDYEFKKYSNTIKTMLSKFDSDKIVPEEFEKPSDLTKVLFSINDKNYTFGDFIDYLKRTNDFGSHVRIFMNDIFRKFIEESVLTYEDKHLEDKYLEFKHLINEYHDGILLFDLTDKMVWSKAIKDTTGLKVFYNENKNNYLWEKRANATIYTCNDKQAAIKVLKLAKKKQKNNYSDTYIIETSCADSLNTCLNIESGLFEKGDNKWVDTTHWKSGVSKMYEEEGKYIFISVNGIIEPTIKTLDEARGLVTADYQNYLGKQWVEELRNKYEIWVDKDVLSTVEKFD